MEILLFIVGAIVMLLGITIGFAFGRVSTTPQEKRVDDVHIGDSQFHSTFSDKA